MTISIFYKQQQIFKFNKQNVQEWEQIEYHGPRTWLKFANVRNIFSFYFYRNIFTMDSEMLFRQFEAPRNGEEIRFFRDSFIF